MQMRCITNVLVNDCITRDQFKRFEERTYISTLIFTLLTSINYSSIHFSMLRDILITNLTFRTKFLQFFQVFRYRALSKLFPLNNRN